MDGRCTEEEAGLGSRVAVPRARCHQFDVPGLSQSPTSQMEKVVPEEVQWFTQGPHHAPDGRGWDPRSPATEPEHLLFRKPTGSSLRGPFLAGRRWGFEPDGFVLGWKPVHSPQRTKHVFFRRAACGLTQESCPGSGVGKFGVRRVRGTHLKSG